MIDITRHTIAETQFQEVHPLDILHECLVMDQPTGTDRPQWSATIFGIQAIDIGIVLTERTKDIITVIVGIGSVGIAGAITVKSLYYGLQTTIDIRIPCKLSCRVRAIPTNSCLIVWTVFHLTQYIEIHRLGTAALQLIIIAEHQGV